MEENTDNGVCKKCGCNLYSKDSLKAGYCGTCAGTYDEARKVWEEKGLAKFCKSCGCMLHCEESIEKGMCIVCGMKQGLRKRK